MTLIEGQGKGIDARRKSPHLYLLPVGDGRAKVFGRSVLN